MIKDIFAIEFFERDGIGERVVFTKVLPDVPIPNGYHKHMMHDVDRQELEEIVEASGLSAVDELCALWGISWACDTWFPNHFYRIVITDWKC